MATIYRFIVENKVRESSGRKSATDSGMSKKTTAKKGKWVSIFSGDKGGVEHNRKMRAINPLLNKITGGYWEKGMRLGRAGAGLVQKNTQTGKIGLSAPAIAIIIAFSIQILLRYLNRQNQLGHKMNDFNFKAMENGTGAVRNQYSISVNAITGAYTYNQNK